jgi:iron complex outermembrane recepter protein
VKEKLSESMKRIMALLVGLILVIGLKAQTKNHVSGTILSPDKKPFASATVELLRAADSSRIKVAVSDQQGKFDFENLTEAKYFLQISAVGHDRSFSKEFTVDGVTTLLNIEPVVLTARSADLKSVTVSATKPLIEQRIDRMVVNVEAFVSNTGANALEVLEKTPGVQVDKDGNISLKGKQGVIVMLDGRPAYLSGAELANLLKGMQASQLEQIEVMTNPPAKYDAAGNSGIINIKTKKNKQKGFNGNISAGFSQGFYPKTNESLSLNYRNGKVNLFSNYSFGWNQNFQELDIYRRYKNDDGSTNAIFEQNSLMKRKFIGNNLKLGMDYYLTKKTTLGIVLGGFYNPETTDGTNTMFLKSPSSEVDSLVYATSDIDELWKNMSANFYVRHIFDSTGRELSADLDYITYKASSTQRFVNTTLTPEWVKKNEENLLGDLPVNIDIYSAKADYIHPIGKEAKLEMGWKSSYVVTDNKAQYYQGQPGNWSPDYGKTFFFDYKENINAAYISINKQINEKWGVQAGLRYENTYLKGFTHGNPTKQDSSFDRSYNSWFPTVFVSYKLHKDHTLSANFGRRIDRPAYQDLNPFLFFLDKYTYGAGNPYMKPQYTNNFELTHLFRGFLTTTLNYSITTDVFSETFDQETLPNGENGYATIQRNGNIGRRENGGVAVNAQIKATKWLTAMVYTNYNYSRYKGVLYGEPIDVSAGNLLVSLNNQMKFSKGWSAELSGWYRTKGVEGQIIIEPFGALMAGVSKQVLKGKGTVKFNIRDIFYSQVVEGDINFKSTEAHFKNWRDTRVANITFTYRFGKPLKNGNEPRNRNTPDEQNRVKSNG